MNALVIAGGTKPSANLITQCIKEEKIELIIGADKGCEYLYDYKIKPDIVLGDFDSISKENLEKIKQEKREIKIFPPEKDYTDSELAVNTAIEKGADKIFLLAATGTRMDHVLGNIGLLLKTKRKNAKLIILDDYNKIYLSESKGQIIKGKKGKTISFLALSDEVENFTIKGAKYNLNNYNLKLLEPLTVSNEFLENEIKIEFEKGEILILHSHD